MYTIDDLFCNSRFVRVILYRSRSLRCEMGCEIHFEENVSMILCLERINDIMSRTYQ